MRYAKIRKMDISNGPGIRVSLFVQGCDKHCKGCFNPETWSFTGGKEFTKETISEIIKLADKDWISGLSILGGEPLHPDNIKWVCELCIRFKEKYSNKNIWIWTGYTMDELRDRIVHKLSIKDRNELCFLLYGSKSIITYEGSEFSAPVDYIVDGPFIESQKDLSLKWRGSSNQHIWVKGGTGKMDQSPNMWYCIE